MAIQSLQPPPFFTDRRGMPLQNGQIYIGVAGLDPVNNPRNVYADAACSVLTSNPISTLNGYLSHNGIPGYMYVKGDGAAADFSILILDQNGAIVYRSLHAGARYAGFILSGFSAANVEYKAAAVDAYNIALSQKLAGLPDIMDYGAIPDGATPANGAIQAMFDHLGYAVIPTGDFLVTQTNILLPLSFRAGGRIITPAGQKNIFRNRIDASPKFQIFGGPGDVSLMHALKEQPNLPEWALGRGFDGHFAFAAWFGIFPRNVAVADNDQTDLFKKAMRAFLDDPREGRFVLDFGGYRISDTITIPPALIFEGQGTVCTTFVPFLDAGKDALVLGAKAKLTGVQFEQKNEGAGFHDGVAVRLSGIYGRVDDVAIWNSRIGFLIEDSQCAITNVSGSYRNPPVGETEFPSDSALVSIRAPNARVENVRVGGQPFAPDSVVLVDARNASTSINNTIITNIRGSRGATPVKVSATSVNVSRLFISNVMYMNDDVAAWPVNAAVDLSFLNATRFFGITINAVLGTEATRAVVKLHHNTSGNSSGFVVSGVGAPESIPSTDPDAQVFNGNIYGSGNVANLHIAGVSSALKPVTLGAAGTGRWINTVIDDGLEEVKLIEDNAVGIFDPWVNSRNFAEIIAYGATLTTRDEQLSYSGAIAFNISASSDIRLINGGANFAVLPAGGSAPTGTTGTNGKVSVWPGTNSRLYVENRSGSAQYIAVKI